MCSQDLLFTEIMADPTPSRGILPAVEYLELFNRSTTDHLLDGMAITTSGQAARPLGPARLPAGGVLILCDPADSAALSPFGQVLPVERFPTLRNAGDELLLLNSWGDTLLRQTYRPEWHHDAGRANGGWSLERLQADLPGNCALNWASSQDERGGSPGIFQPQAGRLPPLPVLLRAFPDSPTEISLFFSAGLNQQNIQDAGTFQLDPFVAVEAVRAGFPESTVLTLVLAEPLERGRQYTLRVNGGLRDCLGRLMPATDSVSFALPAPLAPGDLVINELLFDPYSGGVPFLELINQSENAVNLRDLSLVNHHASSNRAASISQDFLLLPGAYAVITPSFSDLLRDYQIERPAAVVQNELPRLARDRGNISIHYAGLTIDSFNYDEELHSPFLPATRGVSLERIDPDGPTQSPANWHSAAQTAGFATPTGKNSQLYTGTALAKGLSLPYQVFSPDGDGFNDFLLIRYELDQPGYLLQLWIFDEVGRPVRMLSDGALGGIRGNFKWDGTTSSGHPAPPGIYIITAEMQGPQGQSARSRQVAVLAPPSR